MFKQSDLLLIAFLLAWTKFTENLARRLPVWLKSNRQLAREAAEQEPLAPMRCLTCSMLRHQSLSKTEGAEQ